MEPELTINIFQITGTSTPEGRTSDHGNGADSIRMMINENWDKYEKITILFEGIARMSRVFMDEAFAKILDEHSLDELNQKVFFPDAKELIVKDLNAALKLRKKILESKRAREDI